MVRNTLPVLATSLCLAWTACSREVDVLDVPRDPQPIEGLWMGSWGGGSTADGVVQQPVIAELFINETQIELSNFPSVGSLTGTVEFDSVAQQLRITPATGGGIQPATTLVYRYRIDPDGLTLTDDKERSISLQKCDVEQKPLANVQFEFVAASGISDDGELLVTEYNRLEVGQSRSIYYQPAHRALQTGRATLLLVRENGIQELSLDEARSRIRHSTPVVIASVDDDHPPEYQAHTLWRSIGPPLPGSEAALQTAARVLRPGTLIFILSATENIPRP